MSTPCTSASPAIAQASACEPLPIRRMMWTVHQPLPGVTARGKRLPGCYVRLKYSYPSTEPTRREAMKRFTLIAAILIAAVCTPVPARAQEMKKAEAPKPALGPSAALLEEWNDIGRRLTAIAEDMPEDKYDYKPKPEMRSWLGQLAHAAQSNYYFVNPIVGKPFPADDPDMSQLKTRAQVVAFVKKSFQDGADIIKAQGDAGLAKTVNLGGQLMRIDAFANSIIAHGN